MGTNQFGTNSWEQTSAVWNLESKGNALLFAVLHCVALRVFLFNESLGLLFNNKSESDHCMSLY